MDCSDEGEDEEKSWQRLNNEWDNSKENKAATGNKGNECHQVKVMVTELLQLKNKSKESAWINEQHRRSNSEEKIKRENSYLNLPNVLTRQSNSLSNLFDNCQVFHAESSKKIAEIGAIKTAKESENSSAQLSFQELASYEDTSREHLFVECLRPPQGGDESSSSLVESSTPHSSECEVKITNLEPNKALKPETNLVKRSDDRMSHLKISFKEAIKNFNEKCRRLDAIERMANEVNSAPAHEASFVLFDILSQRQMGGLEFKRKGKNKSKSDGDEPEPEPEPKPDEEPKKKTKKEKKKSGNICKRTKSADSVDSKKEETDKDKGSKKFWGFGKKKDKNNEKDLEPRVNGNNAPHSSNESLQRKNTEYDEIHKNTVDLKPTQERSSILSQNERHSLAKTRSSVSFVESSPGAKPKGYDEADCEDAARQFREACCSKAKKGNSNKCYEAMMLDDFQETCQELERIKEVVANECKEEKKSKRGFSKCSKKKRVKEVECGQLSARMKERGLYSEICSKSQSPRSSFDDVNRTSASSCESLDCPYGRREERLLHKSRKPGTECILNRRPENIKKGRAKNSEECQEKENADDCHIKHWELCDPDLYMKYLTQCTLKQWERGKREAQKREEEKAANRRKSPCSKRRSESISKDNKATTKKEKKEKCGFWRRSKKDDCMNTNQKQIRECSPSPRPSKIKQKPDNCRPELILASRGRSPPKVEILNDNRNASKGKKRCCSPSKKPAKSNDCLRQNEQMQSRGRSREQSVDKQKLQRTIQSPPRRGICGKKKKDFWENNFNQLSNAQKLKAIEDCLKKTLPGCNPEASKTRNQQKESKIKSQKKKVEKVNSTACDFLILPSDYGNSTAPDCNFRRVSPQRQSRPIQRSCRPSLCASPGTNVEKEREERCRRIHETREKYKLLEKHQLWLMSERKAQRASKECRKQLKEQQNLINNMQQNLLEAIRVMTEKCNDLETLTVDTIRREKEELEAKKVEAMRLDEERKAFYVNGNNIQSNSLIKSAHRNSGSSNFVGLESNHNENIHPNSPPESESRNSISSSATGLEANHNESSHAHMDQSSVSSNVTGLESLHSENIEASQGTEEVSSLLPEEKEMQPSESPSNLTQITGSRKSAGSSIVPHSHDEDLSLNKSKRGSFLIPRSNLQNQQGNISSFSGLDASFNLSNAASQHTRDDATNQQVKATRESDLCPCCYCVSRICEDCKKQNRLYSLYRMSNNWAPHCNTCCCPRRLNYVTPSTWHKIRSLAKPACNPVPLPTEFILDTGRLCEDKDIAQCRLLKRQQQLYDWMCSEGIDKRFKTKKKRKRKLVGNENSPSVNVLDQKDDNFVSEDVLASYVNGSMPNNAQNQQSTNYGDIVLEGGEDSEMDPEETCLQEQFKAHYICKPRDNDYPACDGGVRYDCQYIDPRNPCGESRKVTVNVCNEMQCEEFDENWETEKPSEGQSLEQESSTSVKSLRRRSRSRQRSPTSTDSNQKSGYQRRRSPSDTNSISRLMASKKQIGEDSENVRSSGSPQRLSSLKRKKAASKSKYRSSIDQGASTRKSVSINSIEELSDHGPSVSPQTKLKSRIAQSTESSQKLRSRNSPQHIYSARDSKTTPANSKEMLSRHRSKLKSSITENAASSQKLRSSGSPRHSSPVKGKKSTPANSSINKGKDTPEKVRSRDSLRRLSSARSKSSINQSASETENEDPSRQMASLKSKKSNSTSSKQRQSRSRRPSSSLKGKMSSKSTGTLVSNQSSKGSIKPSPSAQSKASISIQSKSSASISPMEQALLKSSNPSLSIPSINGSNIQNIVDEIQTFVNVPGTSICRSILRNGSQYRARSASITMAKRHYPSPTANRNPPKRMCKMTRRRRFFCDNKKTCGVDCCVCCSSCCPFKCIDNEFQRNDNRSFYYLLRKEDPIPKNCAVRLGGSGINEPKKQKKNVEFSELNPPSFQDRLKPPDEFNLKIKRNSYFKNSLVPECRQFDLHIRRAKTAEEES